MAIDEKAVALPTLYGAPAYARPPAPVASSPRPFDLDLLPLDVYQADDERRFAAYLQARTYGPSEAGRRADQVIDDGRGAEPRLRPGSFSLRAIAGRLLGSD